MANNIIGLGNDPGDIKFDVDVGQGLIWIRVRPPLGLESSRVSVPLSILEFQDHNAKLTLTLNELQRKMLAELGARRPA